MLEIIVEAIHKNAIGALVLFKCPENPPVLLNEIRFYSLTKQMNDAGFKSNEGS